MKSGRTYWSITASTLLFCPFPSYNRSVNIVLLIGLSSPSLSTHTGRHATVLTDCLLVWVKIFFRGVCSIGKLYRTKAFPFISKILSANELEKRSFPSVDMKSLETVFDVFSFDDRLSRWRKTLLSNLDRSLYPEERDAYTFWSYFRSARSRNIGWRLDYFILSSKLQEHLCDVLHQTGVFGSDHCPIVLLLAL